MNDVRAEIAASLTGAGLSVGDRCISASCAVVAHLTVAQTMFTCTRGPEADLTATDHAGASWPPAKANLTGCVFAIADTSNEKVRLTRSWPALSAAADRQGRRLHDLLAQRDLRVSSRHELRGPHRQLSVADTAGPGQHASEL